jgi:hypothetical protein
MPPDAAVRVAKVDHNAMAARPTSVEERTEEVVGIIRFPVDPFGIPETVSPKNP